jgi:hypothetical protein
MTALVAWVGADSRGPASLNIAADSRITWRPENSSAHHWDQGKKVFASSSVPLVIGFVGDVLFPALVLPGVIDRIDRGVFRPDGPVVEGVISALRRGWRDYPPAERRNANVYVAYRAGERMSCRFQLTSLSYRTGSTTGWTVRDIPVPASSAFLKIDGSGKPPSVKHSPHGGRPAPPTRAGRSSAASSMPSRRASTRIPAARRNLAASTGPGPGDCSASSTTASVTLREPTSSEMRPLTGSNGVTPCSNAQTGTPSGAFPELSRSRGKSHHRLRTRLSARLDEHPRRHGRAKSR